MILVLLYLFIFIFLGWGKGVWCFESLEAWLEDSKWGLGIYLSGAFE
jgi:hypothetical protein